MQLELVLCQSGENLILTPSKQRSVKEVVGKLVSLHQIHSYGWYQQLHFNKITADCLVAPLVQLHRSIRGAPSYVRRRVSNNEQEQLVPAIILLQ